MKIFNMWITGEQLLEGWNAHHHAIFEAVSSGLPVYQDINGAPAKIEIDDFKRAYHKMRNTQWFFSELIFNAEDVATFENSHIALLHKLEGSKQVFRADDKENSTVLDLAIQATVKLIHHCQEQKAPLTEEAFEAFMKRNFNGLPGTIIKRIKNAIPKKYVSDK